MLSYIVKVRYLLYNNRKWRIIESFEKVWLVIRSMTLKYIEADENQWEYTGTWNSHAGLNFYEKDISFRSYLNKIEFDRF